MTVRVAAEYVTGFCRFTSHQSCPVVVRQASGDRATPCTCRCHTDAPAAIGGEPVAAGVTTDPYWGI